jgi:uncharacterized membrane protein required for colicin V production
MSHFTAHWFDFVLVIVLIVGFILGTRKAALAQVLSFFNWALALFICSFLYRAPALWLASCLSLQPDVMALVVFPLELVLVYLLLRIIRRKIASKKAENEPLGNSDHHVAKIAGPLRFMIFILIFMSWINGVYVTEKDLEDHRAFIRDNFGSISFPTLSTVKDDIFNGSYSGRFAKNHLNAILMTAIPRVEYVEKPVSPVQPRERKVKLKELNNEFENEGKAKVPPEKTVEPRKSAQNVIVYHDITLKGISGRGDRLFALINGQTFQAGESNMVKYEERKIGLECVKIRENSVLVRFEAVPEPVELTIGVGTNDKGERLNKKK